MIKYAYPRIAIAWTRQYANYNLLVMDVLQEEAPDIHINRKPFDGKRSKRSPIVEDVAVSSIASTSNPPSPISPASSPASPNHQYSQIPQEMVPASTQMDFIKGFISGQLVVFLLLWFLVRLVFLRNSEEADTEMKRRIREKNKIKKKVGLR